MPVPQLRRSGEILRLMINRVVARTSLTDVARSSQVLRLIRNFSDNLGGAYFELARMQDIFSLRDSTGVDLDARGRDYPLTPARFDATRAGGTVVFSRLTNPGTSRQIAAGVIVLGPTGLTYRTTRATQVSNTSPEQISGHGLGRDYDPVPIIAETPGEDSNLNELGILTRFAARPVGVDEVTNTTTITGGVDAESDPAYLARLENAQASLANAQLFALEDALIGVTVEATGARVRAVRGYEDLSRFGRAFLYIDDGDGLGSPQLVVTGEVLTTLLDGPPAGAAVGGEEYLQLSEWPIRELSPLTLTSSGAPARGALVRGTDFEINPESGLVFFDPPLSAGEIITADYVAFDGLVRECQRRVSGVRADRLTYPGRRAAAGRVQVLPAIVRALTVHGILDLEDGADRDSVTAEAASVTVRYVNGLAPGEEFVRQRLSQQIMAIAGVRDHSVSLPPTNIRPSSTTVVRTSASLVDWD